MCPTSYEVCAKNMKNPISNSLESRKLISPFSVTKTELNLGGWIYINLYCLSAHVVPSSSSATHRVFYYYFYFGSPFRFCKVYVLLVLLIYSDERETRRKEHQRACSMCFLVFRFGMEYIPKENKECNLWHKYTRVLAAGPRDIYVCVCVCVGEPPLHNIDVCYI